MSRAGLPLTRHRVIPAFVASLLVALTLCSSGHAQHANRATDWLAALPLCAMGDDAFRGGETKLLYPRPGLAAVAYGGEILVTRVRLPAPLTPPPGHQQEKALRGWSIELLGRALVLGEGAEHRYSLRVSDVRPDARAGLVYRASVPIPPWVAPGTYDVRIKAPGTRDHVVGVASLRVLAPGAELRVARFPVGGSVDSLSLAPVDVWLAEPNEELESPLQGHGVPWVSVASAGAIFRRGARSLAFGGCDDPLIRFEDLRRVHAGAESLQVSEAPSTQHWVREGDRFDLRGSELLVTFLEGQGGLRVRGAQELSYWPGTPPRRAGHRASVVASIRAEGSVQLERDSRAPAFEPEFRVPNQVIAGQPFQVEVEGEGPLGIAWSWEEDGASYSFGAPDSLSLTLRQMERQVLRAWVVSSRGQVRRQSVALVVETDRPNSSCSVGRTNSSGFAWFFGALMALWYGSRRRRVSA